MCGNVVTQAVSGSSREYLTVVPAPCSLDALLNSTDMARKSNFTCDTNNLYSGSTFLAYVHLITATSLGILTN